MRLSGNSESSPSSPAPPVPRVSEERVSFPTPTESRNRSVARSTSALVGGCGRTGVLAAALGAVGANSEQASRQSARARRRRIRNEEHPRSANDAAPPPGGGSMLAGGRPASTVKLTAVAIDVWMQHPTLRFLRHDMFESLRRWTDGQIPDEEPPIEVTVAAMDHGDVEFGLLSAWHAPEGPLIGNDEVAGWVSRHPDRFRGLAAVDLNRPMEAVRELRRCVGELGFKGLRVVPWLWDAPPTDRRYYPLYAACVELEVPFCTQVGHTAPRRRGKMPPAPQNKKTSTPPPPPPPPRRYPPRAGPLHAEQERPPE